MDRDVWIGDKRAQVVHHIALRGALPEMAFRIQRQNEGEKTVIFDIEIAPAYAIDLIRVTFVHDRNAGSARVEVNYG